jgi:hypothetical protein
MTRVCYNFYSNDSDTPTLKISFANTGGSFHNNVSPSLIAKQSILTNQLHSDDLYSYQRSRIASREKQPLE